MLQVAMNPESIFTVCSAKRTIFMGGMAQAGLKWHENDKKNYHNHGYFKSCDIEINVRACRGNNRPGSRAGTTATLHNRDGRGS